MSDPSQSSPPPAPRAPRPPGTLKVGTVAGSDVLVTSSWFLVAGLIAVIMAPRVETVEPGLGAWKYVAGFAFAIVLYLSVVLHEASHAYMARHYGYGVGTITLHFLGGMTAIESEARTPRHEFAIAVVGPLTSLAVGAGAVGLWFVTPDGLLRMAVEGLAGANLLVGVLNLVPGLPLDGGRVLKSAVWRATGNALRGTIAAGWGGRLAAAAVVAWPFVQGGVLGWPVGAVDILLAGVVAMFLWSGASAAITSARVRQTLPALVARSLARRAVAVPPDLPVAEAVRRAQSAQAGGIVTVGPDAQPVGVVSEAALLAVPADRRPWVPVSAVARSLDERLRLPASLEGEDLVRAIARSQAEEHVLVEADGRVYGVLTGTDVDRAFRQAQRGAAGGAAGGAGR